LKEFDTVIMGRKTSEFGFQYGLKPGQPAYPQMQHYIFSSAFKLKKKHSLVNVSKLNLPLIQELKSQEGSDIYLCGGGEFASWLLDH
jgi:dihydrofolate reductase